MSKTDDSARRKGHDADQHRTIDRKIDPGRIAGDKLGGFSQQAHNQRSGKGTEDGAAAADDRPQQRLDGNPRAERDRRIHEQEILRVEAPGSSRDGRRKHHCPQLDRDDVDTKRTGAVFVLADRHEPGTKSRLLQPCRDKQ